MNIVKNDLPGGTDEKVDEIISLCKEKSVPIAFCCLRKEFGFALYGRYMKVQPRISALSVLNFSSFEKVV